jgi:hypothetical protein
MPSLNQILYCLQAILTGEVLNKTRSKAQPKGEDAAIL